MPTKEEIQNFFQDRLLVFLLIGMALLALILIIVGMLGVSVHDVQLPVRYSDFGTTNTYRDKWYYLISFPLLGLVIAALHSLIAIKLTAKSRQLAGLFLTVSLCLLVYGIVVTLAILHLVSVSL